MFTLDCTWHTVWQMNNIKSHTILEKRRRVQYTGLYICICAHSYSHRTSPQKISKIIHDILIVSNAYLCHSNSLQMLLLLNHSPKSLHHHHKFLIFLGSPQPQQCLKIPSNILSQVYLDTEHHILHSMSVTCLATQFRMAMIKLKTKSRQL